jgi:hypothetical protein
MSEMKRNIGFPPYIAFRASMGQIHEFTELTELSYELTQQLLFKFPKSELPHVCPKRPPFEEVSFSLAGVEVVSIDRIYGWITVEDYALKVGADAEVIRGQAQRGTLGPTEQHPKTGEMLLIWPTNYQAQPKEELPIIGQSMYKVKYTITARAPLETDPVDLSSFEDTQAKFLRLAHALGEPSKVTERAREILNRTTLLLCWTVFEIFLRETIQEMIRRHPIVLISGKRGQETLTYKEVATLTSGFTSLEGILEQLVIRELDKSESGGESVHGLINYLKSQFRFKQDPYKTGYVFKGQYHETSYGDLKQLKDMRNALVHDAGRVSASFLQTYPNVPVRDGVILVDDAIWLQSILLLESIAFNIAEAIEHERYTPAG